MRKWANFSPYMRRPLVIYDFAPVYFLFYQCVQYFSLYTTLWCYTPLTVTVDCSKNSRRYSFKMPKKQKA